MSTGTDKLSRSTAMPPIPANFLHVQCFNLDRQHQREHTERGCNQFPDYFSQPSGYTVTSNNPAVYRASKVLNYCTDII